MRLRSPDDRTPVALAELPQLQSPYSLAMPSRAEQETVLVAGREVSLTNPDKVLFPQAGYTKLDLARYYLAVADGALRGAGDRPNVLVRYPNGIDGEFFFQKRAPESRPDVDRGRAADVSVGPHRRGGRAARRRRAGVDGEPRLPRAASASGARRRSRPSRRAARRPRSGAGRRVAADPRGRAAWCTPRSTTSGWSAGRRRRARAACTSTCASSRRWTVRPGAPRRARVRARGGAPGAGARDQQVVEGRAPRRVPRLQPEREGPHDRERVLGAARRRTRACRRRSTWDEIDGLRSGGLHAARRCRRGSPTVGDRHAGIDAARVLARERCSSCPRGTSARAWATRRGRRTTGSSPAKPPRVQPSRRRDAGAARSSRSAARERRKTRWPASSAGRRATRRRPRTSSRPTCSSTRMRGRFRTWTRIRVNLQHVPATLRPAQEALDPDENLRTNGRLGTTASATVSGRGRAPNTFSSS